MNRYTLPLLAAALLLGACPDRELPIALAPDAPVLSLAQDAMAPVVNATDAPCSELIERDRLS